MQGDVRGRRKRIAPPEVGVGENGHHLLPVFIGTGNTLPPRPFIIVLPVALSAKYRSIGHVNEYDERDLRELQDLMHSLIVNLDSIFYVVPIPVVVFVVIVVGRRRIHVHGYWLVDGGCTGLRAELPAHGSERGNRVFVEAYE